MNYYGQCQRCGRHLTAEEYSAEGVAGVPLPCFKCIGKIIPEQVQRIAELKEDVESWRKAAFENDRNRTEQGKRIETLEVKLTKCGEAFQVALEAIDASLATAQPAGEKKPDPIKEVYEKFKHVDLVICDVDACASFSKTLARDFWLAIKAHVEQGGKEGRT